MIDLHTHTTKSDGSLTRTQLLEFAALCGVDTIAITDHDTLANAYTAPDDPVRVIPAVEMSGFDFDCRRRVHILCYLPADTTALQPLFDYVRSQRVAIGEGLLPEVEKLYPIVNRETVKKYSQDSGIIFKHSLMNVLMDYGYTGDVYGALYRKIFKSGLLKARTDPDYPDYREILTACRRCGGVVVLAHPSVYDTMALARKLAGSGLIDGIEIDHPRNTAQDKAELRRLAARHGLIVTGGTDYHARNNNTNNAPGDFCTETAALADIIKLANERKSK